MEVQLSVYSFNCRAILNIRMILNGTLLWWSHYHQIRIRWRDSVNIEEIHQFWWFNYVRLLIFFVSNCDVILKIFGYIWGYTVQLLTNIFTKSWKIFLSEDTTSTRDVHISPPPPFFRSPESYTSGDSPLNPWWLRR